jgi:HAD superfamily hydrolase (TIGR01549 family)
MAEAVLFDFGGTLDADGQRWSQRLYRGYRAAGGGLALEPFEDRFATSDRLLAGVPEVAGFGFRRTVQVQVELLRELLPDGAAVDADAWTEDFVEEARATAARNQPLLGALAGRFALGVISNFTGNLRPCLTELGLEHFFEVVFDSADLGIRKPDRRIFAAAFDALGLPPALCWMVGDNPFADIAPATAMGCTTCWLAPASRPLPDGVRPTRRIASLTELPAVLS